MNRRLLMIRDGSGGGVIVESFESQNEMIVRARCLKCNMELCRDRYQETEGTVDLELVAATRAGNSVKRYRSHKCTRRDS